VASLAATRMTNDYCDWRFAAPTHAPMRRSCRPAAGTSWHARPVVPSRAYLDADLPGSKRLVCTASLYVRINAEANSGPGPLRPFFLQDIFPEGAAGYLRIEAKFADALMKPLRQRHGKVRARGPGRRLSSRRAAVVPDIDYGSVGGCARAATGSRFWRRVVPVIHRGMIAKIFRSDRSQSVH
jgi:hypothetical protein